MDVAVPSARQIDGGTIEASTDASAAHRPFAYVVATKELADQVNEALALAGERFSECFAISDRPYRRPFKAVAFLMKATTKAERRAADGWEQALSVDEVVTVTTVADLMFMLMTQARFAGHEETRLARAKTLAMGERAKSLEQYLCGTLMWQLQSELNMPVALATSIINGAPWPEDVERPAHIQHGLSLLGLPAAFEQRPTATILPMQPVTKVPSAPMPGAADPAHSPQGGHSAAQ